MLTWERPSKRPIKTNDLPATCAHALAMGWVAAKLPVKKKAKK